MKNIKASRSVNHRGGRPAKFAEPSRPVTVTLPERVLQSLDRFDSDRAKAIVKLVESSLGPNEESRKPVAAVKIAAGRAILLVNHCEQLQQLPWLRLIEVAPARHLISIRSGTSVETMELAIRDLLEESPLGKPREREILQTLMNIIRESRRTKTTSKEEILVVATTG